MASHQDEIAAVRAIEAVLERYLRAMHESDADALGVIFHPCACLHSVPEGAVQVQDWTGWRFPPHAVAAGFVLMRAWAPDKLERYLSGRLERLAPGTVLDAKARLQEVYPFVVEVRLEPMGGVVEVDTERPALSEIDPLDATRRFWEAVEGSAPDAATESLLVDAIAEAARGQS